MSARFRTGLRIRSGLKIHPRIATTASAYAKYLAAAWIIDPGATGGVTETSVGSGIVVSTADFSGHNVVFSQPTQANRPTIAADAGAGGARGLYFNGDAIAWLAGPDMSGYATANGAELWTVMRWTGSTTADMATKRFLCYRMSNSLSFTPFDNSAGVTLGTGNSYIDALTDTRVHGIPLTAAQLSAVHIQRVVATPTGRWEMFMNGVSVASKTGNAIAFASAPWIGGSFQVGFGYGFIFWQMLCLNNLGANESSELTARLKATFTALP